MAHKPPALSRTLCELATELVINILEEFDMKTLVFCRQVCRFLKEIVDESIVLRYKIELAIAGMEDGPPSDTSVADRLRRLRKYTTAWAELKWESIEQLPLVNGDLWELYGGVLGLSCGPSTLVFHRLPGHARGIKGKEWRIKDVGFTIREFKMDPSQDLLVMIEVTERSTVDLNPSCKVHLWTLSTGKPHPSCTHPAIVVPVSTYFDSDWYFDIIMSGDNLGIMIAPGPNINIEDGDKDVFVWNWKSSRVRTWIRGSEDRIRSFAFLTDRHLLLAMARNNKARLEVYDMYDMDHTSPTKLKWSGTDYLCAFLYPDACRYLDVLAIQSDPSPSWSPANDVEVPFFTAQNNRVFSVSFGFGPYKFMHFIPSSVLRSRLSRTNAHEGTIFAWEEWGPMETLMDVETPSAVWVCNTNGSKHVRQDWSGRARDVEATVLDFNVVARKPQPLVVQCTDIWNNMQTSLPFIRVTAILPPEVVGDDAYVNIMLSEDNLIVVNENDDGIVYHVLTI